MSTIAFTGRRPNSLYGYQHDAYQPLFDALYAYCHDAVVDHDVDTFITGGAQGADQLAFWSIHALKRELPHVRNLVYIPYAEQDARWKPYGPFGQHEYTCMLKTADEVINTRHKSMSKHDYRHAYIVRNHAMVDDADSVCAIFNPINDWHSEVSGTAATMRYANTQHKPIVILNPFTLKITAIN